MPAIYLSPSTQERNLYVTGSGSEEQQMNLLADDLTPYLLANSIAFQRNRPEMTAASSVRQANRGRFDLYLALHSNASPPGRFGAARGIVVFHYPGSRRGEQAAGDIADALRQIYPLPDRVFTRADASLGEVRLSRAPAVLAELGYHDNRADALWVERRREAIARQLARGLTAFFGLPFIEPMDPVQGRVDVAWGALNLRSAPSRTAQVLSRMPDGAPVTVRGAWQGWYAVEWQGRLGYAAAAFIVL